MLPPSRAAAISLSWLSASLSEATSSFTRSGLGPRGASSPTSGSGCPSNPGQPEPEVGEDAPRGPRPERVNEEVASERDADSQDKLIAAAREGGSIQNFRHLPNKIGRASRRERV